MSSRQTVFPVQFPVSTLYKAKLLAKLSFVIANPSYKLMLSMVTIGIVPYQVQAGSLQRLSVCHTERLRRRKPSVRKRVRSAEATAVHLNIITWLADLLRNYSLEGIGGLLVMLGVSGIKASIERFMIPFSEWLVDLFHIKGHVVRIKA